jgi:hypothetical protein
LAAPRLFLFSSGVNVGALDGAADAPSDGDDAGALGPPLSHPISRASAKVGASPNLTVLINPETETRIENLLTCVSTRLDNPANGKAETPKRVRDELAFDPEPLRMVFRPIINQ